MAPTIKQLQYLIALDDYCHFGKAAAACFISQSAFSIAIKELENNLNVQLVERTNKNVIITDIGKAIVGQARLCLGDVEALMNIAAGGQEPLSGRVTLGVIPTIAPFLLPAFIPEARKRFPNMELYLREDKTADIHAQLQEGKLDLILVALPFPLRNVRTMPLFRDPFLLACGKDSKWLNTRGKKGLDLQGLPKESVLLLDDGHCLRDHALSACDIRNAEQISRFSATSLQTLLQMVVADLGITFVPAMARDMVGEAPDIELYPMPGDSYREIGLAWRKGSSRGDEFTMLGELLKELHRKP